MGQTSDNQICVLYKKMLIIYQYNLNDFPRDMETSLRKTDILDLEGASDKPKTCLHYNVHASYIDIKILLSSAGL